MGDRALQIDRGRRTRSGSGDGAADRRRRRTADLGQVDAALAQIQRLGLDKAEAHPRLAYAYADLLLKADRRDEALSWFIRAANADLDEETDALERLADLGVEGEPADADESLLLRRRR